MNRSLDDFIAGTMAATSVSEVGDLLRSALAGEGFPDFALIQFRNGALSRVIWDFLQDGFVDDYAERGLHRVDPLAIKAKETVRAFAWRADQPGRNFSHLQLGYFAELRDREMLSGMVVPLHGPNGQFDLMGVATSEAEPPSSIALRRVHAFALQAWLRRGDLDPAAAPPPPPMSQRELECLKWVKDGKTNWEISQILGVSEKTVEFHLGNLMRKLGAESRLAAVIFALRAGILEL